MSGTNKAVGDTTDGMGAKGKVATKKESKERLKAKSEVLMYLGPSIKGAANHGQIFRDGISPALAEKIEKIPVLKNLCFPMDEATRKFAELKAGGPVSKLYEAAAVQLKKKGDQDE